MNRENIETTDLIANISEAILEKGGKEILILDLNKLDAAVSKYFIICHASSTTQVDAISEEIIRSGRKNLKEAPFHVEGKQNYEWVLVDYIDVVVHVFLEEKRHFYNLENLWADAKVSRVEDSFE